MNKRWLCADWLFSERLGLDVVVMKVAILPILAITFFAHSTATLSPASTFPLLFNIPKERGREEEEEERGESEA